MLTEANARGRAPLATTIGALAALIALTFFAGALLHLGLRISLGVKVLMEPRILPATIVEGLCGLFLAVGAYAALVRKSWAWPALTAAHVFALGGVLLGMVALAVGAGPSTELNIIYHRVVLAALVLGLVLLLAPAGKAAFGRGGSR